MQIIWSKGPRHTASIFKQLKNTQTGLQRDPDLQKIARIGKVGSLDNDALSDQEDEQDDFNRFMPIEFLKRLPGIDSNNIKEVVKVGKQHNIRTMVDLCKADEETIAKMIGQKKAKQLYNFLSRKVDVV
eukprot:CAMPEP_0116883986 /NCGR_PEP_ID=MMETSP0463-20121206/16677_1 /TAXON_ID=181622 /ORGANISM="Strombidinopsis sp, Strain SopsisLIS2011" /LENGTH=128 /DNA_ID=CAMNT_0004539637 /DNA_START=450 /DNA_END=832 /DNA_ORIENTATION=-